MSKGKQYFISGIITGLSLVLASHVTSTLASGLILIAAGTIVAGVLAEKGVDYGK